MKIPATMARSIASALARSGRDAVNIIDDNIKAQEAEARRRLSIEKMEANNAAMRAKAREEYQNENQGEMF